MLHYTSGGQFKVPVVVRGPGGVGRQLGAEHSQRLESYFQSIPGVQLVAVSTVANAKALLKSVRALEQRHKWKHAPATWLRQETLCWAV
jgi:pyruvate dehydrogenase E1 component beta subunit